MNLLGNIIWLVFGGLAIAVEYFIGGLVLCLTIIGIPFGLQAFRDGTAGVVPIRHKHDYQNYCLYANGSKGFQETLADIC